MKTICDKCNNYVVSPDSTREKCWANITDKEYIAQRMGGMKKKCKEYKSINQ